MKRMMGGLMVLAMTMAVHAPELAAQRGPRGPRGFAGGGRGAGVERIMRMREELELTDGQFQELDALREEVVRLRSAHQAEMAELMSQLQVGEIEREAVRDAVEERAGAMEEVAEQHRERVEAILNDTQRETLEEMGARDRAFNQGYARGMRGNRNGMRRGGSFGQGMGRPGMPGGRGGFAPRRGPGLFQRPGAGFGPGFGQQPPGMGPGRGGGL